MAKCKNCRKLDNILNRGISVGRWCVEKSNSPNIELERICDKFVPMTQGDKIRNMTDEELAWFLCKVKADYQWIDQEFPREDEGGEWEEWLKSEVGCE